MLTASWKQPKLHEPHIIWCAQVGEGERQLHEHQSILPLTAKMWDSRTSLFSPPRPPLPFLGFYSFSPNHIFFYAFEVLGNLSQATEKQLLSLGSSGENPRMSWPFVEFVRPPRKAAFPIVTPQALKQISPSRKFQAPKARNANACVLHQSPCCWLGRRKSSMRIYSPSQGAHTDTAACKEPEGSWLQLLHRQIPG